MRLYREGQLAQKILAFKRIIENCTLCPHQCGTNRILTRSGKCHSGQLPIISSYCPHFGEEPPLSGNYGSGTIFFGNCNLACVFCQNFDISQCGEGNEVDHATLARIMLHLQNQGCHNINFVSPTHMSHAILMALPEAIEMGLKIPLVYNSGGFDSVDTLRLLEGIFDIYMPDIKYMDNHIARKLSGIEHYPESVKASIIEMHRQVGDLQVDHNGIATRGLMIRHLVLPENMGGTFEVIDFVHSLSPNTYFNLMDQYHPAYKAHKYKSINRRITREEYSRAYEHAVSLGLHRLAN